MSSTIFEKFPEFDLDDIVLRELEIEDAEYYYHYMIKPEMTPFVTKLNIPTSMNEAIEEIKYWRSLFNTKRSFYWGIALKESNQLIGTVGYNNISLFHRRGEISYDLDYSYWKKGLMLKSVKTILRFADMALMLMRVQATVIIDNYASIKLLDRCGFKEEGTLKKYEMVNGSYKDYYMYARVH